MADIWFAKDGSEPTTGESFSLPLTDCIALIDLKKTDYLCGADKTPRFGAASALQDFRGPQHVVVEVERSEAQALGWKPGFYGPRIAVAIVQQRMRDFKHDRDAF